MMTNFKFVDMPCLKQPTFLMATAWTAKSFRPPEFDDGLKTTFFVGKVLLPVPKTRDFCLHDRSPGYPPYNSDFLTCGMFIAIMFKTVADW